MVQDATGHIRHKLYQFLRIDTESFFWKCFCGFITFFFIDISWLFFRSSGMYQSISILKKIRNDFNPWYFFSDEFYNIFVTVKSFAIIIFSFAIILLIDIFRRRKFDLKNYLLKQQIIYRWIIYFTIIFIIMLWGAYGVDYGQTQFIYFQF